MGNFLRPPRHEGARTRKYLADHHLLDETVVAVGGAQDVKASLEMVGGDLLAAGVIDADGAAVAVEVQLSVADGEDGHELLTCLADGADGRLSIDLTLGSIDDMA